MDSQAETPTPEQILEIFRQLDIPEQYRGPYQANSKVELAAICNYLANHILRASTQLVYQAVAKKLPGIDLTAKYANFVRHVLGLKDILVEDKGRSRRLFTYPGVCKNVYLRKFITQYAALCSAQLRDTEAKETPDGFESDVPAPIDVARAPLVALGRGNSAACRLVDGDKGVPAKVLAQFDSAGQCVEAYKKSPAIENFKAHLLEQADELSQTKVVVSHCGPNNIGKTTSVEGQLASSQPSQRQYHELNANVTALLESPMAPELDAVELYRKKHDQPCGGIVTMQEVGKAFQCEGGSAEHWRFPLETTPEDHVEHRARVEEMPAVMKRYWKTGNFELEADPERTTFGYLSPHHKLNEDDVSTQAVHMFSYCPRFATLDIFMTLEEMHSVCEQCKDIESRDDNDDEGKRQELREFYETITGKTIDWDNLTTESAGAVLEQYALCDEAATVARNPYRLQVSSGENVVDDLAALRAELCSHHDEAARMKPHVKLLSCRRVYGPWGVLKSGIVLVDLPGFDINPMHQVVLPVLPIRPAMFSAALLVHPDFNGDDEVGSSMRHAQIVDYTNLQRFMGLIEIELERKRLTQLQGLADTLTRMCTSLQEEMTALRDVHRRVDQLDEADAQRTYTPFLREGIVANADAMVERLVDGAGANDADLTPAFLDEDALRALGEDLRSSIETAAQEGESDPQIKSAKASAIAVANVEKNAQRLYRGRGKPNISLLGFIQEKLKDALDRNTMDDALLHFTTGLGALLDQCVSAYKDHLRGQLLAALGGGALHALQAQELRQQLVDNYLESMVTGVRALFENAKEEAMQQLCDANIKARFYPAVKKRAEAELNPARIAAWQHDRRVTREQIVLELQEVLHTLPLDAYRSEFRDSLRELASTAMNKVQERLAAVTQGKFEQFYGHVKDISNIEKGNTQNKFLQLTHMAKACCEGNEKIGHVLRMITSSAAAQGRPELFPPISKDRVKEYNTLHRDAQGQLWLRAMWSECQAAMMNAGAGLLTEIAWQAAARELPALSPVPVVSAPFTQAPAVIPFFPLHVEPGRPGTHAGLGLEEQRRYLDMGGAAGSAPGAAPGHPLAERLRGLNLEPCDATWTRRTLPAVLLGSAYGVPSGEVAAHEEGMRRALATGLELLGNGGSGRARFEDLMGMCLDEYRYASRLARGALRVFAGPWLPYPPFHLQFWPSLKVAEACRRQRGARPYRALGISAYRDSAYRDIGRHKRSEHSYPSAGYQGNRSWHVLHAAVRQCHRDNLDKRVLGATTALVITLQKQEIHMVSVGDCQVAVLDWDAARGSCVYLSKPQHHWTPEMAQNPFPNPPPLQLGFSGREMECRSSMVAECGACDLCRLTHDGPELPEQKIVAAKENTLVIAGSDGLFDNLPHVGYKVSQQQDEQHPHFQQHENAKRAQLEHLVNQGVQKHKEVEGQGESLVQCVGEEIFDKAFPFMVGIPMSTRRVRNKEDDFTFFVGRISMQMQSDGAHNGEHGHRKLTKRDLENYARGVKGKAVYVQDVGFIAPTVMLAGPESKVLGGDSKYTSSG
ncbi:hypothetical protein CYMTET_41656 [Cymbomonas tetramitiformis]|uniref:PPM-type phosphatase domain-containing protein n=1 Tax=Cymbomonas tetramitiformis TaxID=36881 RepID=A0AAE0C7M4_9CHLO|nr:hypothetical protein CYMTET_41656 [Cymbomonas tetramitiformis]